MEVLLFTVIKSRSIKTYSKNLQEMHWGWMIFMDKLRTPRVDKRGQILALQGKQ